MRINPIYDSCLFLIGQASDYGGFGASRYILVVVYAALIIGSLVIASANWSADSAQRSIRHATIWLFRMMIGTMWFQGSLWKLPLPVSDGFIYWQGQMVENAAFAFYGKIMKVTLENIVLLGPLVYFTETIMAATLILGFATRLGGLMSMGLAFNLWIGLYHNGAEWPWEYIFIIVIGGFFVIDRAGRSLGLDAYLSRTQPLLEISPSATARLFRLVS